MVMSNGCTQTHKGWGKKGNIIDPFFAIAIFFGIAIAFLIFYKLAVTFNDDLAPMLNNPTSTAALSETVTSIALFDSAFILVVVFLMLSVIISAFFIQSHPIFFFILTPLFGLSILFAAIFSNAFETFRINPNMVSAATEFDMTVYVMDKLPYFIAVFFILMLIFLVSNINWSRGYEA